MLRGLPGEAALRSRMACLEGAATWHFTASSNVVTAPHELIRLSCQEPNAGDITAGFVQAPRHSLNKGSRLPLETIQLQGRCPGRRVASDWLAEKLPRKFLVEDPGSVRVYQSKTVLCSVNFGLPVSRKRSSGGCQSPVISTWQSPIISGRDTVEAWKGVRSSFRAAASSTTTAEPLTEAVPTESGSGSGGLSEWELRSQASVREETILLDVKEMMCGGCAAAVKTMLTSHPDVASASVNLVTETAVARVNGQSRGGFINPKAGSTEALNPGIIGNLEELQGSGCGIRQGLKETLGEELAKLLTEGGFPTTARQPGQADAAAAKRRLDLARNREEAVKKSRVQVAVAASLAAICCGGHAGHIFHLFGQHHLAHGPMFAVLNDPYFKAVVSLAALLGPARDLVVDGFRALGRRVPNMNSLVGLGAIAAFAISSVAVAKPELGWDTTFFEEPVMLLAVVLLGRALEAQARASASSDLQSLLSLLPATCRLLVEDPNSAEEDETSPTLSQSEREGLLLSSSAAVEVPTDQVRSGDFVLVLPGETVPVDGKVQAGRSAVDESMLTGEALPVPKERGNIVSAGTINWEGPIAVEAIATGANCAVSAITRMVEEAQGREAPVQRLADRIAGPFVFSIMALSTATFSFWYFLGTRLFPSVLLSDIAGEDGSALLLSLKLAIDVLVVACPCALGLATPTAVLVGTSMGATRGLLLRGGDALERLANVDTIVLDKTGTLTEGRPSVAAVAALGTPPAAPAGSSTAGHVAPSESEVLCWAAALETATRHPMAAAIISAAQADGCQLAPVQGVVTVPGRGVVGTVGGRQVAVGELQWVARVCGHEEGEGSEPEERQVAGSDRALGVQGTDEPDEAPGQEPGEEDGKKRNVTLEGANASTALHGVAEGAGGGEYTKTVAARLEEQLRLHLGEGGLGKGRAKTVVYMGLEGQGVVGAICAADRLRPDTHHTIGRLRELGIKTLVMSGDDEEAVQTVAGEVGIEAGGIWGRLLPADKAQRVGELRERGACVAMVGDGVNDAPALAAADVGVALPQGGASDAASDAASVILLGNRLSQLVEAIDLARATLSRVRLNLVWALAYNAIAIPLAAGALLPNFDIALTPSLSGGMMAVSSIAVVTNSILLRLHPVPPNPLHKLEAKEGL